ncbi:hypothetical protein BX257_1109 [Streptomyces sp. 3212.3]|nr:hypothetical protein BX257_1109 [Streptomyces sp. 3212.3]
MGLKVFSPDLPSRDKTFLPCWQMPRTGSTPVTVNGWAA